MKARLLYVFLIFCCVRIFWGGDVWAQTFTSNSGGGWSTASIWTRTNPNFCFPQYASPPPTNASNINCSINVVVNHAITNTSNTQFAQQFRSLQIRAAGSLNFTQNNIIIFTNNAFGAVEIIVDGGILELHSLELSNGSTLRVINGGRVIVRNNLTTSGSGNNQINVDATSRITVTNTATIASGHLLNVNGTFSARDFVSNGATITIGSPANFAVSNDFNLSSSGSMSISGSATVSIGRDFVSNGSAAFTSTNNSRISTGRNFTNNSSGNFNVNANSELTVTGNFSSQGGGNVRFVNDTRLAVGGSFAFGNGNFQVSENSRVAVTGNASHTGGTFISSNYADIRINGNLTSMAGTFNASGYSFLGVGGSHTVSDYNGIFNLSGNSQVQVNGNTTTPWNTLNAVDNSCYKSANRVVGSGCVICGATYTADGTFAVPAGVTSLTIEVWGAGGAGGSANTVKAGGGGGGAYSKRTVAVTPAQTLYIFTGRGATGSAGTPSGGGTTYVAENATQPFSSSLIFARGGSTPAFNSTTGALGGAALTNAELTIRTNSISYKGGDGASTGDPSGGGGSAAANNGNGNNGQVPSGGADPPGAGGPGGNGSYYDTPGNTPPYGNGGGGGGAFGVTGTNRLGGNGANGLVLISFTCPETQPCSRVIDYGLNGQQTVVEYFCNGTWTPPTGLKEYSVSVIGGGGGGGYGNAAGGGGGGSISRQTFSDINKKPASGSSPAAEIGLPANTTFEVKVGQGGIGASASSRSTSGGESGIYGTFINYAGSTVNHLVVASGGGGGGSTIFAHRDGLPGGSGGGGGVYTSFGVFSGSGGASAGIGLSTPGADGKDGTWFTYQGGGGGGAGAAGSRGTSNNNANSTGGIGGVGAVSGVPSKTQLYAAGGGGTSSGALNNNNIRGMGGNGGGGHANNTGPGVQGSTSTGSGGGAGSTLGGNGGSGTIFINYSIYSILPVEFLSFTATYQSDTRSGLLNWATAKEWENEGFDIQRSVNNVRDWETIGQVQGAGYSDKRMDYAYQDLKLPLTGGNIFYRLKQRDYDGDSSYSDTKSIQVEKMPGTSYWRVFPNPTSGDPINLELLDSGIYRDEPVIVRIISASGHFDVVESRGGPSLSVLVSHVLKGKATGVYTIEISWNIYREYHKIILSR